MTRHISASIYSLPVQLLFALAGFVLSVSWVGSAHAMPPYPGDIQSHLQLNYTPSCTLCHATPAGGGPIATKFGNAMVAAGLTTDESTLIPALDKLNADNTDSDGDGIPDIQALKDGLDPSSGKPHSDAPVPKYGCGASISTNRAGANGTTALALVCLGMLLVIRRRMSNLL